MITKEIIVYNPATDQLLLVEQFKGFCLYTDDGSTWRVNLKAKTLAGMKFICELEESSSASG